VESIGPHCGWIGCHTHCRSVSPNPWAKVQPLCCATQESADKAAGIVGILFGVLVGLVTGFSAVLVALLFPMDSTKVSATSVEMLVLTTLPFAVNGPILVVNKTRS